MTAQNLIEQRVELARQGQNKWVIAKFPSGWLVIGDVQPLLGYCVFLADPVVPSINDLDDAGRTTYSLDTLRAGDAILKATGADRMNYETLGNSEPALHTHLIPRYGDEPPEKRRLPAFMVYSWTDAPAFDPSVHGALVQRIQSAINRAR
ncbi:MAG: hypothetical protein AAFX00_08630 [Pseudomonadota bacterium]